MTETPGLALVTGGAGFIGSHLVEELLVRSYPVRVLDNFSTGSRKNIAHLSEDIDLREGDIRDILALRSAMKNVDVVFHFGVGPTFCYLLHQQSRTIIF